MFFFERLSERILRSLRKKYVRFSRYPRPASYPYISGDGFRKLANHIYDDTVRLSPESVQARDIVFVRSDLIHDYFTHIHPHIAHPYILISHNSDQNIGPLEVSLIDSKIIHWFSQNVLVAHEKVTPIPIGIENAHYGNAGVVANFRGTKTQKKNGRIFVSFNVHTNFHVRSHIKNLLDSHPLIDVSPTWLTQKQYMRKVREHSYIVSPPGGGVDCHRTWEALYVGTIPLVERSYCMEYFIKIGLPLCIVDDWSDIHLPPHVPAIPHPALDFSYWRDTIHSYI